MFRPRVIPVLLVDNEDLIKTIQFKSPRYIGDPINAVKIFNEKEVDELSVIDRSARNNGINFKLLSEIANEAFMPLSYGGGIHNLEDAIKIIELGFEKVILNEASFTNPNLIKEISKIIGSQSVVVSIDYKKIFKRRICLFRNGKLKAKVSPIEHALKAQELGAGEILLTSIDHEGTKKGYDFEIINEISNGLEIPLIVNGGARRINDFSKAINLGASAVSASSLFIYFGQRDAVLINFPKYIDFINEGVYLE